MHINPKTPAVECLENGKLSHVQETFHSKQHFLNTSIFQRQKIARIRKYTESNQRKLTELSNSVY